MSCSWLVPVLQNILIGIRCARVYKDGCMYMYKCVYYYTMIGKEKEEEMRLVQICSWTYFHHLRYLHMDNS